MAKVKTQDGASGEDGSVGDSVDAGRVYGAAASQEGEDAGSESEDYEAGEEESDGLIYGHDAGFWTTRAQDSYTNGKEYVDSSLRGQWERNERAFNNRHRSGSKYHSDAYKFKSKLYRPKTRAMIRQGEAHCAAAFFSNLDVISVSPMDERQSDQKASAEINKELLQYRLTTPDKQSAIPWFQTLVGAYQDAQKYGFVTSKQYWKYDYTIETEERPVLIQDPATGEQVPTLNEDGTAAMETIETEDVLVDRPCCDLIPPENIIIDRSADWTDPIGTSPYVILGYPLYIIDIEQRMEHPDDAQKWHKVDRPALMAAKKQSKWDSTRSERDNKREDPKGSTGAIEDYHIVWCHENFMRVDGEDYVFWTAGTNELLTDPVPVYERYHHCKRGERPITMGNVLIETHTPHPAGKPELVQGLQDEANDIVNLRLDNVKLALGKRYIVKRGKQVDVKSLLRNAPSSVTYASNVTDDVKVIETRDVTSSAYAEQDRINADFDDTAGQMSTGTVQTNRRLNETVGGMEMLSGAANTLAELDIRVFTETWVEPTLRQIMRMEQVYESDEVVLAIAANKSEHFRGSGQSTVTEELLQQNLLVRVGVGIGATSPEKKVKNFQVAAKIVGEIFGPKLAPSMNVKEILNEIFAPLGYRDGSRFFNFEEKDPMVQMLLGQIDELQKKIERKELDQETKVEVARMGAIGRVVQQLVENQGRMDEATLSGLQNLGIKSKEMDAAQKEGLMKHILNYQGQSEGNQLSKYQGDQQTQLSMQQMAAQAQQQSQGPTDGN